MKKRLLVIVCMCSIIAGISWFQSGIAQTLSPMQAPSATLQATVPQGRLPIDKPRLDRPALPDLIPVSCAFNPPTAKCGDQNIHLWVKYRNAGNADATIGARVYEWTAECMQANISNMGLFNTGDALVMKPGTERYSNATDGRLPLLAPGAYTFTVKIDSKDLVGESNELNNDMQCTLTILPPGGDLSITKMVPNPATPSSTQFTCVYVTVTNTGKEPLTIPAGTLMVTAPPFAEDAYVSQAAPSVMQPGAGWTYMMRPTPAGRQKGTQSWTFTADPKNRVVERMETNNTGTLQITVN